MGFFAPHLNQCMARSSLFSTPAPERETKQQSRGEDIKYDATFVFPVHKRPLAGMVTLQIPLPHDVLGVGVPQASIHLSHVEMEALVAQRHVQQQQGGHSHSHQLQKRRCEERKEQSLMQSCFQHPLKPNKQNLLQALGCAPRAREHKALGALQRLR